MKRSEMDMKRVGNVYENGRSVYETDKKLYKTYRKRVGNGCENGRKRVGNGGKL